MSFKVCCNCLRINKSESEECYVCGSEGFDELRMTPRYDSIEAYHEEPIRRDNETTY